MAIYLVSRHIPCRCTFRRRIAPRLQTRSRGIVLQDEEEIAVLAIADVREDALVDLVGVGYDTASMSNEWSNRQPSLLSKSLYSLFATPTSA